MKVLIVGGSGRMGMWMTRYFKRRGFGVHIYDVDGRRARLASRALGVQLVRRPHPSLYDLVLLSVPPQAMREALAEYSSAMKPGQLLAEICSAKLFMLDQLRAAAKSGLKVLSLHPLFGPGARLGHRGAMIVVGVRSPAEELMTARALFPGFRLLLLRARQHDLLMARTLWGPFLACASFAAVARGLLTRAEEVGGPRFVQLSLLALGLLKEEPGLYVALRSLNPFAGEVSKSLLRALSHLDEAFSSDPRGAGRELARLRLRIPSRAIDEAYARLYGRLRHCAGLKDTTQ